MESTYRKATETQYEYRRFTVQEYMEFARLYSESAVHRRLRKVDEGKISRDILDYEQLAPGYPKIVIARVKISRATIH